MKALRFYGIEDVRCETVAKPQFTADEVLIKVSYAGICGSDLHIYKQAMFVRELPMTMGHEFVGEVVAVGAAVRDWRPGEFAVANPMLPCLNCTSCLQGNYNTCDDLGFIGEVTPGCFAEYIAVDQTKLIKVPPTETLRSAALAEPLAVALNICEKACLSKSDQLVVLGAGPIGLLTVIAAKTLYGVEEIAVADLSWERLTLAKQAGASRIYNNLGALDGAYPKIVETAGTEYTINQALKYLTANGFLYVVSIFEQGVCLDVNQIVSQQLQIVGCNVYTDQELREAVQLIAGQQIKVDFLITHEFRLAEGPEAFRRLSSPAKKDAKILFRIGDEDESI